MTVLFLLCFLTLATSPFCFIFILFCNVFTLFKKKKNPLYWALCTFLVTSNFYSYLHRSLHLFFDTFFYMFALPLVFINYYYYYYCYFCYSCSKLAPLHSGRLVDAGCSSCPLVVNILAIFINTFSEMQLVHSSFHLSIHS